MGQCSNAVFSVSTNESLLFISTHSYIGTLWMTRMQVWPNDRFFESFEVIRGQIRFLPLIFDRIKRWEWHFSPLAAWLICNMTYLVQHVTSLDLISLDLRSNSYIDLLRSICTYLDESRREEHDAAKSMSLASLVQRLFAKKTIVQKALFWPLTSVA